ncbi:glycosyltransferase family 4 protein [Bacillus bombysepticus]|uniref:Glycosyltransferase n=1 Tax=Bacillus bombysepticus str. Wang TaxID=1330043 RepID=A0A9W3KXU5_9BACI|nr:glycosyltransferase family 4 protein [Bacillus bombysepticus]AHX21202.1 glycosyltransferase [Bacillus bombysepticus str. Wang]
MKILIFNTLYYPNIIGGAEKSVQLLAEMLVSRGHEPIIVSTFTDDKIDEVNGIKIYYLHHRNLYWSINSKDKKALQKVFWHGLDVYNPRFSKEITNIILNEKPDVIHTNNITGFSTIPWIIAKKFNIPVVHTLRDFSLICSKSTMFKGSDNCSGQCSECKVFSMYKKGLTNKQHVDYVVGNSHFMIQRHKELGFFQDTPSARIFNGTHIRKEGHKDKQLVGKLKFFYMGRIDYTKGIKLLLDVFTKVQDAELILAGKVYEEEIEKNIEKNTYPKNIKFLGYINPNDILSEIDILIAPSLWNEPLPRVILEAYSYGKPAIGTDRGGIPECIINNKTGFIFNPDNPMELEKIIRYIIDNPIEVSNFSKNIPSYLEGFDIEKTVDSYIDVYSKVIKS